MEYATDGNSGTNGGVSDTLPATAIFAFEPNSDGHESGGNGGSGAGTGSGGSVEYNKDGSIRRKRGRKPGVNYGSKPTTQKAGIPAVDAIAGTLYGVHTALAVFARVPELALSEDEAKQLAKATAVVAEVSGVQVDPRVAAYINLATVAASIYGPRALAIYFRVQNERKQSQQSAAYS